MAARRRASIYTLPIPSPATARAGGCGLRVFKKKSDDHQVFLLANSEWSETLILGRFPLRGLLVANSRSVRYFLKQIRNSLKPQKAQAIWDVPDLC